MPLKEHLYRVKNKAIMQAGWGMGRVFITGRNHNKPFIAG